MIKVGIFACLVRYGYLDRVHLYRVLSLEEAKKFFTESQQNSNEAKKYFSAKDCWKVDICTFAYRLKENGKYFPDDHGLYWPVIAGDNFKKFLNLSEQEVSEMISKMGKSNSKHYDF